MTRHTCAGRMCLRGTAVAPFLSATPPGQLGWAHLSEALSLTETRASDPLAWWVWSLAPGAAAAAMDAGPADLALRRWGGLTSDVSNN